jgi:ATP-dependent Zn protease
MGRHVWFRTPTKDDRKDIFDLYLAKVSHSPDLDTPERRDELARITSGYSPAMIEQISSMALTYAHHDGREAFEWPDLLEAMTTVESGTAIGQEYIPEEKRAVAIHEAGHAIAAHVYFKEVESTRLSIRRRGSSGGHHQARQKEERFAAWRHEMMGRLIWGLGAMAAEHVFYNENTTGVGGDVQSATADAAMMVGQSAMSPLPIELKGEFESERERERAEAKIMKRFETIGLQIMNRAGGGMMTQDPLAAVYHDQFKRQFAAQLLGQAYMSAHLLMQHNRVAVERVAEVVMEHSEIYGDDLVKLLDAQNLQVPEVDLTDESVWPTL